ncbi:MAG: hypothetical protein KJO49_10245 [Bacteroidia bacterium]|nr:hypothetical protein [Bacteroidia bacterium]MBT8268945.1 hypothetical protein [Bacteroidia bacterium]NNL81363.1 hypothetical protein [Flavobacteriaceae bacterium]
MQSNNYLQSKMHYFGIVGLAFLLVSCGSYQYAGYEEDAIYGESGYEVEYVERVQTGDVNTDPDNGYYKNYFKEKALQYEAVSESDAVFTDIDSYEGNYEEENDSIRYTEGYAGWGQDHNQDVSINIYGGGLYNNIWWNRPIGWNWGWNYGYPYGYGWNNWGWNNWGWNVGIGWNNWDPFWCPPYYGWGGFYGNQWAYGWGGAFYGSGYYGRRVAYTNSRRSPLYSSSGMASVGRRSSLNTNYSSRRGSVNNSAVRPNSRVRPEVSRSRPSSSRTRPAVGTNSRVKPSATVRPGTKPRVRPNSKPRTRPASTVKPRSGNSKPVYRSRPSSTKRNNRSYNNNNRSRSNNRSSNFSRSSSSRSSSFSRSSGGSTRSSGSRSGGSRRGGRM